MLNSYTKLPAKDIIMKSDVIERAMIQCMCEANRTNPQLQLIGDDCVHHHGEADIKNHQLSSEAVTTKNTHSNSG